MDRHLRRQPRAVAAALLAAAAFTASALRAPLASAQSVQVFINSAFVVDSSALGSLCTVSAPAGGSAYYDCPAPDATFNPPTPQNHFISNDPEIQFAENGRSRCNLAGTATNPLIQGTIGFNVCNSSLFMCAQVGVNNNGSGTVALDQVQFELFRYVDGANALDPASTPPLRTFFIDSAGSCGGTSCYLPASGHAYCVMWDGSQAIQGGFGKINGQYGFRVTVQTNQVGQSGNITITQTRAYPSGGVTYDATPGPPYTAVSPKAMTVNVNDVHVVRSTPTIVGQITGVSAEPYNFTYRLAKDATMYFTINQSQPPYSNVRTVVPGLPRTGEGSLATANANPIVNGDSWDGRDRNGNLLPPGNYLAVFQSNSVTPYSLYNPFGGPNQQGDLSASTTVQIGLDPLQITDIRVQPLLGGSTVLAVMSYQLTEPATVYLDIYPPGTTFCNDTSGKPALNDTYSPLLDPVNNAGYPAAKNFMASSAGCTLAGGPVTPVTPLRTIVQQQNFRTPVISFWDGRDVNGTLMGDGDYVFVLYAALPSQAGTVYNNVSADTRLWTSQAKIGFIPVVRGLVGITQVTPTSTVIGSSPAVAGLNQFTFRYQLSRDAVVSLKVYDPAGTRVVKTLVNSETRPGLFNNVETWVDGAGDNGMIVSSGTYLVQLTAWDPVFPAKISTTTALFPIDLFRITDVSVTPLLSGASDQVVLNYQLSQPMFVAWNIYAPGSVVVNSTGTWPPCSIQSPPAACTSASVVSPSGVPVSPVVTFRGMRPGRLRISEFWDGRDVNGLFVPDGSYVFTLTAQSSTTPQYFASDRVYGNVTVARGAIVFLNFNVTPDVPSLFNSSNTITLDPFTVSYTLSRQSSVTIQILNTALPPQVVRTLVSGSVRQNAILQTDVWDGRDDKGNFPPAGFYLVRAVATDVASVLSSGSTAQQTISYDPLRIYDLAVTPMRSDTSGAVIAYQVSEPMKVAIKIYKPGTVFDASGNPSPPESVSLVRRIVGIRPARTQIQDVWDGRDFRLSLVPDGNYKFKIVGSTDANAIDSLTGNIINPTALAEDRLVDDLPVATNGASANPEADFLANTFMYPNPATGPTATFSIYNPFHGRVLLKLYTIAGDLVLSKDFGDMPPSFQNGPVTYAWSKVNQSGRSVARGLYYAVFRVEETEGGGTVFQTVKKVLVP